MSFMGAVADGQSGLAFAETRFSRFSEAAPEYHGAPVDVASDGEAFTMRAPGGRIVTVPAAPFRNVRPLPGGWATGTMLSPCLQLVYEAVADHPAHDFARLAATVARVVNEYRAAVASRLPATAARLGSRGELFLVAHTPGRFVAGTVSTRGEIDPHSAYNAPPDCCDDGPREQAFIERAQAPFERICLATPNPLARLRAAAQFVATVYELCGPVGTVNNTIEAGVVLQGGARFYLTPTPAPDVIGASDAALEMALRPVEEVVCPIP